MFLTDFSIITILICRKPGLVGPVQQRFSYLRVKLPMFFVVKT